MQQWIQSDVFFFSRFVSWLIYRSLNHNITHRNWLVLEKGWEWMYRKSRYILEQLQCKCFWKDELLTSKTASKPEFCYLSNFPLFFFFPHRHWSDLIIFLSTGDFKAHPKDLIMAPCWLKAFKGNELQRLIRKKKMVGDRMMTLDRHNLEKRIRFLYRRFNRTGKHR